MIPESEFCTANQECWPLLTLPGIQKRAKQPHSFRSTLDVSNSRKPSENRQVDTRIPSWILPNFLGFCMIDLLPVYLVYYYYHYLLLLFPYTRSSFLKEKNVFQLSYHFVYWIHNTAKTLLQNPLSNEKMEDFQSWP